MKKIVLAMAALYATMGASQAQNAPAAPGSAPFSFVAGVGGSVGGDDLATAQFTNGSSATIKAGGGLYLTAGANYRLNPQFSVQGTLNFHRDNSSANNGNMKFQRFPIELLGYYHVGNAWRVGGGLRYVTSAELSSSGVVAGLNLKFDNTTSGVVEAEYFWTPKFGMKMRYVNETFKAAGYREVKASHFGISGNYYF
jgi:hypothetical protein